ncbi:protein-L-isoaspartate(D-aspartate) O-methyltransferase, partial [Candidatus Bathyarchaeota archaeon]|nr:protein-L-isoaspartate(D-aspartate) O-methyltransferase [Candidatus Bathyarchaeota archaeon]
MAEFSERREQMVQRYLRAGYIKSDSMVEAVRRVPREEFMDSA